MNDHNLVSDILNEMNDNGGIQTSDMQNPNYQQQQMPQQTPTYNPQVSIEQEQQIPQQMPQQPQNATNDYIEDEDDDINEIEEFVPQDRNLHNYGIKKKMVGWMDSIVPIISRVTVVIFLLVLTNIDEVNNIINNSIPFMFGGNYRNIIWKVIICSVIYIVFELFVL